VSETKEDIPVQRLEALEMWIWREKCKILTGKTMYPMKRLSRELEKYNS